jgi:hypothetical protein
MTLAETHKCKCKCGLVCARADLYKHFTTQGPGAFMSRCRTCCNAALRARKAKKGIGGMDAKAYQAAYAAKYYNKPGNREKRRDYLRDYYKKNKPEILAQKAQQNRTVDGRAAMIIRSAANRKKDVVPEDVLSALVPDTPCYICGVKPAAGEVLGLDRVDNDIGYLNGNMHSCCWFCNQAKSDRPLFHFLKHVAKMDAHLNKQN